jgi:hypothetical protein
MSQKELFSVQNVLKQLKDLMKAQNISKSKLDELFFKFCRNYFYGDDFSPTEVEEKALSLTYGLELVEKYVLTSKDHADYNGFLMKSFINPSMKNKELTLPFAVKTGQGKQEHLRKLENDLRGTGLPLSVLGYYNHLAVRFVVNLVYPFRECCYLDRDLLFIFEALSKKKKEASFDFVEIFEKVRFDYQTKHVEDWAKRFFNELLGGLESPFFAAIKNFYDEIANSKELISSIGYQFMSSVEQEQFKGLVYHKMSSLLSEAVIQDKLMSRNPELKKLSPSACSSLFAPLSDYVKEYFSKVGFSVSEANLDSCKILFMDLVLNNLYCKTTSIGFKLKEGWAVNDVMLLHEIYKIFKFCILYTKGLQRGGAAYESSLAYFVHISKQQGEISYSAIYRDCKRKSEEMLIKNEVPHCGNPEFDLPKYVASFPVGILKNISLQDPSER